MTHLLDTNVCIQAMKGQKGVIDTLRSHSPDDIGVSMLTVFELYTGIALCSNSERESAKVQNFLDPIHIYPFDRNAARQSAEARALLQRKGNLIGPYDILIAGHALSLEVTLVTNNTAAFSRVSELCIEDWQ